MRHLVLLAIIGFFITGCGKNYRAEREFYNAEKVLKTIEKTAAPSALDAAVDAFQVVVDKYPSTNKAIESLNLISNMRLKQERFEDARAALEQIVRDFGHRQKIAGDARFRIGQIYEKEGLWDKAEKIYWDTAEFHALHSRGLYSPLHILLHYKRAKDEKGFSRVYAKTLDHFKKLAKNAKTEQERDINDMITQALKVYLNASYGVIGFENFPLYEKFARAFISIV